MPEVVISVHQFSKQYGDFLAVDGVSFEVKRGDVFALLGPNGAGKTTTLECLEGLRRPDAGELRVMDVDPTRDLRALRNLIGVQLQTSGLPDNITVKEALNLLCAYHGKAARLDLIERIGLADKVHTQYQGLSTGQKRRLQLALAIAHEPAIVFLDEPTAGLDVASRAALHDLIGELQQRGVTIMLSSHDMAEVEKLANRVAILLRGKIAAEGSPRELTTLNGRQTRISIQTERGALNECGSLPAVTHVELQDGYATYLSTDPAQTLMAALSHLNARGDVLVDLRVERPTLEERFLEITGKKEAVS